jgi:hypothetical protein
MDPDAEISLIDEQGKDAAGKLILTLISVVSHCHVLQRAKSHIAIFALQLV